MYTPTPWLNREPSASVIMPRAGRAGAVCRRGFDASSLRRSAAAAIAFADGATFTLEKRARPSAAAVDARLTAVDARWPPVAADIRAREMREATASSRQPEDVSASDCRASSDITNGLSDSRRAVESTSMPTPGVATLGRRGRGGAALTDARRWAAAASDAAATGAGPVDPRRLCAPCGCAARFFISVLVRTMPGLPPADDVGDSPGSGAMVETRDACSSAFMSDDCRRESSIFAFTSSWSSSFDAWRIAAISARELCLRESCGASAGGGGTQPASSSLCVDIRAESGQGNARAEADDGVREARRPRDDELAELGHEFIAWAVHSWSRRLSTKARVPKPSRSQPSPWTMEHRARAARRWREQRRRRER